MRSLALADRTDPAVRGVAAQFAAGIPAHATRARAEAIRDGLARVARYLPDPIDMEFIRAPHLLARDVLSAGQAVGDCDDLATLAAAVAGAAGVRSRLEAVSYRSDGRLHHVRAQLYDGARWLTADPFAVSGIGRPYSRAPMLEGVS